MIFDPDFLCLVVFSKRGAPQAEGHQLAVVEFKAQVGPSFGNNFNNRVEEALGNASDLWAAYREGAFSPSARPWLGYAFILEDCEKSNRPVSVKQPHFPVFQEFNQASYAERYEIFLTKFVRERLYDGACLLMTNAKRGVKGLLKNGTGTSRPPKFAG